MYRIWHNFKRWKRDDTLRVLLLGSCTFTHSSWVSLSLPNICSFFFESHNLSPLWISGQHGTQGSRREAGQWDRIDLQYNSTAFMENRILPFISSVDSFFSPWLYSTSFVQSKEISSIPQSLNATSKIQCVSAVCPAPFHRQTFQYRQRSRGGNLLQKGIGIKTRNAG